MPSHALVIGGGLAGFCAARAIGQRFDKVTIVERDELPDYPGERTGVPQARHAHVILDRGRRELERLFPGFEARMVARGATAIDPALEFATHGANGWSARLQTSARMLCAGRDLTDSIVREFARALVPNLEVRTRTEVADLRVERSPAARLTQVTLTHRDTSESLVLSPDLVVDASGRGSKMLALLGKSGVEPPDETVVDSGTWYSTRWFKSAPGHALPDGSWWKAAILVPTVARPMGALLAPVEGDRWIVSIATVGLGQPAIDEANFAAKLRELPSPIVAEAVGEPVSKVYRSRSTPNRRFHFERWTDPVGGFVALGDSACAFNPIQGQGVTSTAVCAHALEDALAGDVSSPAFEARFHRAQARWFAEPWGLAAGFDLRFPTTTGGKRSVIGKIVAPYMKLFVSAARSDLALQQKIAEVGQLNQPAGSLMAPAVVARVLRGSLKQQPQPAMGPYPPREMMA